MEQDRAQGAASGPATFIVRLFPSEAGRVDGVVERPRTGEKRRVRSLEAVGRVIGQMLGRETGESRPTIARQRRARTSRSERKEP
jgi:hypothetical protein